VRGTVTHTSERRKKNQGQSRNRREKRKSGREKGGKKGVWVSVRKGLMVSEKRGGWVEWGSKNRRGGKMKGLCGSGWRAQGGRWGGGGGCEGRKTRNRAEGGGCGQC